MEAYLAYQKVHQTELAKEKVAIFQVPAAKVVPILTSVDASESKYAAYIKYQKEHEMKTVADAKAMPVASKSFSFTNSDWTKFDNIIHDKSALDKTDSKLIILI